MITLKDYPLIVTKSGLIEWRTESQRVIKVGEIDANYSYARLLQPPWLRELKIFFDIKQVGEIVVFDTRKENGKYEIYKGNHRRTTITSLFGPDEMILVTVYDWMPIEERAKEYEKSINDTRRITPMERFKTRLISKHKAALEIKETCDKNKVTLDLISDTKSRYHINSADALYRMYERNILDDILKIIINAYGDTSDAYSTNCMSRDLLRVLIKFFDTYKTKFNIERLAKTLGAYDTAEWLSGGKTATYTAETYRAMRLTEAYNKRLRKDKLNVGDIF